MSSPRKKKNRAPKTKRIPGRSQGAGGSDRRREWRFALPLPARVEGRLPWGSAFKEEATLENISSKGAFFCLDSGVSVGSKINVIIDIPEEAGGGRRLKLRLGGITVRLEETDRKGKSQGVAVRFQKDFKLMPADGPD
ncbi:MAG: PilZ domain-containing protein [Candidatus Aminicenantes bacterium]|nr:PilZ domain-containing protein [Candidatus Aminicenantes bacterium]